MNSCIAFLSIGLVLVGLGQQPTWQDKLVTPWLERSDRQSLKIMDIRYTNQDGAVGTLGAVMNKPTVIAFFYTRCQNAAKCSMTMSRLAALQKALRGLALNTRARILALTYEPQFDTPDRIHRFGADRGFVFGPDSQALQLDPQGLKRLIDAVEAPVNYNAGWVNTHGVDLTLFDAAGRLVRKYSSTGWNNSSVVDDIRRLAAEK